ncbi:MAG TPA: helix-turn-helix domain-containing protein [Bryobacteraceae bacterium]|nr:helix-turn-helix domain-containing protein [Bryobacteraceae bacterium]
MLSPDTAFDLLTMSEVAELLHCSKAHICNLVAGRVNGCPPLPAVPLGRRKLVRRESLLQWIERNELGAATDNHGVAANDNLTESPKRGRKSA